MDSAAPKRVAQEAEQSTPFQVLARAGYAASGLVHILIGVIALVVAFGGDGVTDQSGALMAIASVPFGFVLLWCVAVTLWALAAWQLLEGILMRAASDDAAGSREQVGSANRRVGSGGDLRALGAIAAAAALGARVEHGGGDRSREPRAAAVPRRPDRARAGGPRHRHRRRRVHRDGCAAFVPQQDRHPRARGRPCHRGLGLVGFIAKGIALVIVGLLLIVASLSSDAETAGGLDGALQALLGLTLGPLLVAEVGARLHRLRGVLPVPRALRAADCGVGRGIAACQPPGMPRPSV